MTTNAQAPTSAPINPTEQANSRAFIDKTKNDLTQTQIKLGEIIDAMAHNPSMISRAAAFWGNRPIWQKIILGIVIVAPPLLVGFLAQMIVCFVISAFILSTYVFASVTLDDHHAHNKSSTQGIKSGIFGLADGLEAVIAALRGIGDGFSKQIGLFEDENEQLSRNVCELKTHNEALSEEIDALNTTEHRLRATVETLEASSSALQASASSQAALLEENQALLTQARADYQRAETELQQRIEELSQLKLEFTSEIETYKNNGLVLQDALTTCLQCIDMDEQTQHSFNERLTQFIANKEVGFLAIQQRLISAEQRLEQTQQRYDMLLSQYENQLSVGDAQIRRLQNLRFEQSAAATAEHGIYAHTPAPDSEKTPSEPLMQEHRIH